VPGGRRDEQCSLRDRSDIVSAPAHPQHIRAAFSLNREANSS
jgi:hypothetical protein